MSGRTDRLAQLATSMRGRRAIEVKAEGAEAVQLLGEITDEGIHTRAEVATLKGHLTAARKIAKAHPVTEAPDLSDPDREGVTVNPFQRLKAATQYGAHGAADDSGRGPMHGDNPAAWLAAHRGRVASMAAHRAAWERYEADTAHRLGEQAATIVEGATATLGRAVAKVAELDSEAASARDAIAACKAEMAEMTGAGAVRV